MKQGGKDKQLRKKEEKVDVNLWRNWEKQVNSLSKLEFSWN